MHSIALLLLALPGPAQLDFPRPLVAVSPDVRAPAAGKLDADAHTDLVAVDRERSELLVTLGQGNGYFSAPVTFPTGPQPVLVRLADVDQDGILDAVVAWQGGTSGGFSVHLGDGLGGFGPHLPRRLPWPPARLIVEDLNGDGIPDVLVVGAAPDNTTALVLLGSGSGSFSSPIANDLGAPVHAVATGDLGGDQHRDLFASVQVSGASAVWLFAGAGNGTFALTGSLALNALPHSIAVGDLDGDGNDDLSVIISEGWLGSTTLESFLGDGTGGFGAPVSTLLTAMNLYWWPDLLLADVDGDGVLDAVIGFTFNADGTIQVRPGLGTGAFGPSLGGAFSWSYRGLAVADLGPSSGLDLIYAQAGFKEFAEIPVGFLGVVRQQVAGGFEYGIRSENEGLHDARVVRSRDVDGDGFDDVVSIGNAGLDHALAVHRGDGSGGFTNHSRVTFSPQISGPGLSMPADLLLGHLDGDGLLDALAVESDELLLFRGLSGGRFASPTSMGTYDHPLALADFDGDGLEELVVGRSSGGPGNYEISIQGLVGNAFMDLAQLPTIGPPGKIVTADFDGDGNQDFAVQLESSSLVRVHLGNGDFTFSAPLDLNLPHPLGDLIAADLNGDGLPELVASLPALNVVVVWPNLGGSFGSPVRHTVGQRPQGLTSADFDGDDIADVAVFHGSREMAILSGQVSSLPAQPRFFACYFFPVAGPPQTVVAAPGQRPDILFTGIGDAQTGNVQSFLLLENLTP